MREGAVSQARVLGAQLLSKFGRIGVSDKRRLKAPEAENARFMNLLAETMLENEVTKAALRKNGDRPSEA